MSERREEIVKDLSPDVKNDKDRKTFNINYNAKLDN